MWTWLKENWLLCLSVWAAANTVLSPLVAKLSPAQSATWWGKALHVMVAVSPMDVMKAMKAIGAQAVPPTAGALLLLAALGAGVTGCAPAAPAASPQVDVRALADASVQLLEVAWEDSAQACLAAANAAHDDTIRQKCEPVLTSARNSLIAAQSGLDAWTAADQKNVPCLIASIANSMQSLASVAHIVLPQTVIDGVKIAESYVGQCGGAS